MTQLPEPPSLVNGPQHKSKCSARTAFVNLIRKLWLNRICRLTKIRDPDVTHRRQGVWHHREFEGKGLNEGSLVKYWSKYVELETPPFRMREGGFSFRHSFIVMGRMANRDQSPQMTPAIYQQTVFA